MALDRHPNPRTEQPAGQVKEQKQERVLCSATGGMKPLGPLIGTAWNREAWIVADSPLPWGEDAIENNVLGAATTKVNEHAEAAGVELLFSRVKETRSYTALVASTRHGEEWCERITFSDPRELRDLDLDKLHGPPPGEGETVFGGERVTDPVALVCTNGRVDPCCAIRGNPLAKTLGQEEPIGTVKKVNHFGGHRYAPVAFELISGRMYGRLDVPSARTVMAAVRNGETPLIGMRGHTGLNAVGQVAEGAVLDKLSNGAETVRARLTVKVNGEQATVTEHNGGVWLVKTKTEMSEPVQPGCGKPLKAMKRVILDKVTPSPADHRV